MTVEQYNSTMNINHQYFDCDDWIQANSTDINY